jgi:DNA polymerase epsilon subunit 2
MEFSVETIAREYNKQDGDVSVKPFVLKLTLETDATMKVSLDILRRVYDTLQDQGNAGEAEELLDPDSHLYFVDAFEMPSWHWSQERGTFEKCVRIVADSQLWTSFKSDHLALSLLREAQTRE